MKTSGPNDLETAILACIASLDPRPVEMMSIYNRLVRRGQRMDLLLFGLAICDLEDHGYIRRAHESEATIGLVLEDKGREHFESKLPAGIRLVDLQKQVSAAVEEVTGQKVPRVC